MMRKIPPCLIAVIAASLCAAEPSAEKKLNVLMICVDDLRPELASFGAEYIRSPNIDRLASLGRPFQRHFVNAPSCGPSRFTLLTGRYGGASNSALFRRAEKVAENPDAVPPSMPEWFRKHGYATVSVGKVSHSPGGRGGKDWDDDAKPEVPEAWDRHLMPCGEWQNPRGAMHGLAHGEIRVNAGEMDVFQSAKGPDTIYPDGLIALEGLKQLEELAAASRSTSSGQGKPFFLAIGLIKPHLPFGAPKKYMDMYKGVELPPIPHPDKPKGRTTWHESGEFMKYNRWGKDPRENSDFADKVRLHYAACVSYADKHVGDILARLKETGADKNTIVVLWGDHGWHLGEYAVWGKHTLFEESLHAPLIIHYPGIAEPGVNTDAVVETLDIFPTLCELAKLPMPEFAQGESLVPMLEDPAAAGHAAIGYWNGNRTIRDDRWRMIKHKSGYIELYDFSSEDKGSRNVADDYPEVVKTLTAQLEARRD